MGRSDNLLFPFYKNTIIEKGDTALLGFTNNNHFKGDLYDSQLNNWDINSNWELSKKYDTIICTRCAYFAKDPLDFIARCYNHLNKDGILYVDWGLGDHWRFKNYKVGWVKDNEHEYAYSDDNFLWSTVWHDSFINNNQYKLFEHRIEKFGYTSVKDAIFEEVPSVLKLHSIIDFFEVSYSMLSLWDDLPQLYTMLICKRLDK